MVESTALEMRHTGNCIGGSNPSLSANSFPQGFDIAQLSIAQRSVTLVTTLASKANAPAAR